MPDFVIRVKLKDVAEGDATTMAQDIWDREVDTLDEGDLVVEVLRVDLSGAQFDTGWEPQR